MKLRYEPFDRRDVKDVQAAELDMAFQLGFWADPIFKTGDYPDLVRAKLKELNTPLPQFTPAEIKRNKLSADFFGLNHYTTSLVKPCDNENEHDDCDGPGFREETCHSWPSSGSDWLKDTNGHQK